MVSSQTLITLTVISIIRCSDSNKYKDDPEIKTVEDNPEITTVKDALHYAGYSNEIGFLNYCYVMQFKNHEELKSYMIEKKIWNPKAEEIVNEFYDVLKKNGCDNCDLSTISGFKCSGPCGLNVFAILLKPLKLTPLVSNQPGPNLNCDE
ncbi:uncharacterized protein LOC132918962 [Rhopalosiphum padi]|uniref:uncharacterized protein LOC132918962 n=1 Tax=Rhopalosiphum padi TaxID=40932 RepID=UPI00298EC3C3|nr:uncharacterized protein LOC132918962 [Rhopalosiphum padi]